MFNKKKQPPIKSLIAQGSQIVGNLTFTDGLRVDGEITGNAHVTGQVQADHVIINGSVNGPVRARKMMELQPKARIQGDVHYAALEMHQGALITGQMRPMVDAEEKPLLKLAANNP